MAAYTIHKITTRSELEGFAEAAWEGWWNPYLPNIRIAAPIHGNLAADVERAKIALRDRLWNDFSKSMGGVSTGDEEKIWLYAKHVESGQIVGGVVLNFASASPFPNGCPQLSLYWWPEGEEVREFCEEMMNQVYTPRSMWMQQPHGGMWNFVIHPDHRGRGVGQMLLEYNNRELDERGVEGFVEATELGRPAYEKAGYRVVMKVNSYLPAGKERAWAKWYHEMGMAPWYAMWRPRSGKLESGERTRPWQDRPSVPIL